MSDQLNQPSNSPSYFKKPLFLAFRDRRSIGPIETPRRGADLKRAFSTMENSHDTNTRDNRQLIRKITKGFDEKDYLLAAQEERIKALEARVEACQPRRRKKVKLSPNSRFASMEDIARTKIGPGKADKALVVISDSSESESEASTVEESCIVVAPGRGRRGAR